MRKQEALDFFGNQSKLAASLGVTRQAVSQWGDDIPGLRALQIEEVTSGQLKADRRTVFKSAGKV